MHRMFWAPILLALLLAIPIVGWIFLAFFVVTRVVWFIKNLDAVISSISIVSLVILFSFIPSHPLVAMSVTTVVSLMALSLSLKGGYSILSFLDVFFSTPMGFVSLGLSSIHATGQLLHLIEGTKHALVLEPSQTQKPSVTVNGPSSTELINHHSRSSPDGIVENNLSYHGPGKITPNEPLVHVNDYVRTTADGISSNNLTVSNHYEINIQVQSTSEPLHVETVQPESHSLLIEKPIIAPTSKIRLPIFKGLEKYIFTRPIQDKLTRKLISLDSGEIQAVCAGLKIYDRTLFVATISPQAVDHKRFLKSLFSELLSFIEQIDFLGEYMERKVMQQNSQRNYEHLVSEVFQQSCSPKSAKSTKISSNFSNTITAVAMTLSVIFGAIVILLSIIGLTRLPHGGLGPEYDLSSSGYLRVVEFLHLDALLVERSYEIVVPSSRLGIPLLLGLCLVGFPFWIRHRKFSGVDGSFKKYRRRRKPKSKRRWSNEN